MALKLLFMIGQLTRGGAEQQLYNLLSQIPNPAVVVSFSQGGEWADPIRALGHEVIELKRRGRGDLARLTQVIALIRAYKPDVAHLFLDGVNGLYGRIGVILTGHPRMIVGERNVPTYYRGSFRRMLPLLNRFVRVVVCNSHEAARYYLEHGYASPEKVRVIPNGIDLDALKNAPVIAYPFPADWQGKPIIACIGGIAARKSPETFVRVAAQVRDQRPDARFVMVGEGSLRPAVEALRDSLGMADVLHMTGLRRDVPSLLRHVDILAMTSRNEGTPNIVLEAMVNGIPCAVTDTGDCRVLVESAGNGIVSAVDDEAALTAAWIALLEDPERAKAMGAKGIAYVEQYTIPSMAAGYLALYDSLMKTTTKESMQRRKDAKTQRTD